MDWRRVGVKRESGKQGLISITSSLFFSSIKAIHALYSITG